MSRRATYDPTPDRPEWESRDVQAAAVMARWRAMNRAKGQPATLPCVNARPRASGWSIAVLALTVGACAFFVVAGAVVAAVVTGAAAFVVACQMEAKESR